MRNKSDKGPRYYGTVRAHDTHELKRLRNSAHLTQEGLAEKAGIYKGAVSRLEQGGNIARSLAEVIATVLGMPFESLFDSSKGLTNQPVDRAPNHQVRAESSLAPVGLEPVHHRGLLSPASTFQPTMDERNILELASVLHVDGYTLLKKVLALKEQEDKRQRLRQFHDAQDRIRRENINTRLLELYYRDEALSKEGLARYVIEVNGQRVATNIAAAREGVGLQLDLQRERGQFKFVPERSFQVLPPSLDDLAELLAAAWLNDVQAANDPIFCLQDFKPHDLAAPMSFSLARYFDFRLTYGKLGDELSDALIQTDFDPDKAIAKRQELLPRRKILLPNPGAINNCRDRLCAGGVNVLVALRRTDEDHDDFVFYIEQRSDKVASARGEQSVIPSGFHAVLVERDASKAVSPSESVFRELGEELFRRDEAISHTGQVDFDSCGDDCPPLRWFKDNKWQFVHEVTSFGFDLTDGSFQFGILLVVQNPDYWDRYRSQAWPNYEFRHTGANAVAVSTKDREALATILKNPLCSHTSIFTIVPALRRLKMLEPGRVDIPDINLISRW